MRQINATAGTRGMRQSQKLLASIVLEWAQRVKKRGKFCKNGQRREGMRTVGSCFFVAFCAEDNRVPLLEPG